MEAEEHKANEAIRRKGGKDIGVLREEMKVKESIKAAEQARKGASSLYNIENIITSRLRSL